MSENWRVDLRCRVTWGDPQEEIRQDLIKRGLGEREVDEALEEAYRERQAHFRWSGLRDVGLGALSAGGAALLLFGLKYRGFGRMVVAFWFMGAAGLWLLYRGLARLLRGGTSEGAASDVEM